EGIRGIGKGRISAGGSVYARYLENAYVEASQDVIIGESVIQSTISAGGKVIVRGESGQLVGGFCCAGREIEAKSVGSQLEVATQLQVGIKPDLMAEIKAIIQKEAEVKAQLERITNTLQRLLNAQASRERKLSVKEKILLRNLREARQRLQGQIQEIETEREEFSRKVRSLAEGRVKVQNYIYPGVTIKIGELSYYVRDKMQHVVFLQEGDEIAILPYC
ncbi:MAG: Putative polymerase, partial [Thermacetogenium phaeum]